MNEKLSLQDLVGVLAQKAKMTQKDADKFYRELFQLILDCIYINDFVKIKDLGTFKLVPISSRESVDVNTGEKIEIPAHFKLGFTPDKKLRSTVNRPFSHFESVVLEEGVVLDDALPDDDENDEDVETVAEQIVSENDIDILESPITLMDEQHDQMIVVDAPKSVIDVIEVNETLVNDPTLVAETEVSKPALDEIENKTSAAENHESTEEAKNTEPISVIRVGQRDVVEESKLLEDQKASSSALIKEKNSTQSISNKNKELLELNTYTRKIPSILEEKINKESLIGDRVQDKKAVTENLRSTVPAIKIENDVTPIEIEGEQEDIRIDRINLSGTQEEKELPTAAFMHSEDSEILFDSINEELEESVSYNENDNSLQMKKQNMPPDNVDLGDDETSDLDQDLYNFESESLTSKLKEKLPLILFVLGIAIFVIYKLTGLLSFTPDYEYQLKRSKRFTLSDTLPYVNDRAVSTIVDTSFMTATVSNIANEVVAVVPTINDVNSVETLSKEEIPLKETLGISENVEAVVDSGHNREVTRKGYAISEDLDIKIMNKAELYLHNRAGNEGLAIK